MDVLEILAWVAATAVAVWAVVPAAATALGWTRLEIGWRREELKEGESDQEWSQKAEALEGLGFRRMGTATEKAWLFHHHWKWSAPDQTLMVLPDSTCFAVLYRLSPTDGVRIAFETYLSDDGRVATVLPGVGLQKLEENRLRVELPVMSVADLYARHTTHVETFLAGQPLRPLKITPEERREYEQRESLRELRSMGRLGALAVPALFFVLPTLGIGAFLPRLVPIAPSLHLPVSLLLGGACYAFVLLAVLPPAIEQAHRESWNPPAPAG